MASAAPHLTEGWAERLRQSLWAMPAWTLSLLVHVIVLMALALVTAVVIDHEPEVVISTSISGEPDESIEDFSEIEMEEPDELIEEQPLFQPEMPEMPKLTFDESAMASATNAVAATTTHVAASEGAPAAMTETAGSPTAGSETGKAVTFYGSKSKGNRFVFLIDNSPNMNNEGRMLMALDQLMRAVNQMSAKQWFYVIFYSDRAYPLFFPDTELGMVEAQRRNKQRLQQWLSTVELCDSRPTGSKAIEETLRLAKSVDPSTIYFLTDGDYARKVASVLDDEPLNAPLNVIGLTPSKMTNQSERDAVKKLQKFAELAEANRGTFTPVPSTSNFPSDVLVERNRDEPGPVWGTYRAE